MMPGLEEAAVLAESAEAYERWKKFWCLEFDTLSVEYLCKKAFQAGYITALLEVQPRQVGK